MSNRTPFEWDGPRLARIWRASLKGKPLSAEDDRYAQKAWKVDPDRYTQERRPIAQEVHRGMNPWQGQHD